MAQVTLEGLTKEYNNEFVAVEDLNLEITDGEFLVMVGPSGCGKSTTLRMIAGLEHITDGTLRIDDRVVNDIHPKDRDIAMVFQNYALYPHMTVESNIGFGLRIRKRPKPEIQQRVSDTARLLDLMDQLAKKPGQLSGGQRQRVAMGRAIVRTPQVFLLDEPLSNLDAKLRVQMRGEITELQRKVGVTTFYVTHDQVEAMTMADRVAVMNRGLLQQVAPPQNLFDHPDNLFVAAFIGSPSMNLVESRMSRDGNGRVMLSFGSVSIVVPDAALNNRPGVLDYLDKTIVTGFRPKDVYDTAISRQIGADHRFQAKVQNVEALGHERIVYLESDAKPVVADEILAFDEGSVLDIKGALITARFTPNSTVAPGETIEVGIDLEAAHFFDPKTGNAIRN